MLLNECQCIWQPDDCGRKEIYIVSPFHTFHRHKIPLRYSSCDLRQTKASSVASRHNGWHVSSFTFGRGPLGAWEWARRRACQPICSQCARPQSGAVWPAFLLKKQQQLKGKVKSHPSLNPCCFFTPAVFKSTQKYLLSFIKGVLMSK